MKARPPKAKSSREAPIFGLTARNPKNFGDRHTDIPGFSKDPKVVAARVGWYYRKGKAAVKTMESVQTPLRDRLIPIGCRDASEETFGPASGPAPSVIQGESDGEARPRRDDVTMHLTGHPKEQEPKVHPSKARYGSGAGNNPNGVGGQTSETTPLGD